MGGNVLLRYIKAYFIIVGKAVTLHVAGITDINAVGILGVDLIGVPVLAGALITGARVRRE